jgi:hypothetical protein
MLRVEVAGACFDGLPVSNETDKSEYLGARNCKADPNKAAAACQIEFSGGTGGCKLLSLYGAGYRS